MKSLLPIPKFLPSPAPPPFPTPRLSQLQRIRCTSDKNKQVCVLIARRGWGLCLRSQEVKEGHDPWEPGSFCQQVKKVLSCCCVLYWRQKRQICLDIIKHIGVALIGWSKDQLSVSWSSIFKNRKDILRKNGNTVDETRWTKRSLWSWGTGTWKLITLFYFSVFETFHNSFCKTVSPGSFSFH